MTRPLRVLITNITLGTRTGTELYVRDLAIELLKRGHEPVVYSPDLGEIAAELRAATVPVVDDLDGLTFAPDLIHAHHHLTAMTALLRFPGVPLAFFFHDSISWHDVPPRSPRILRYVAVDHTCRDRLAFEHGIPEERLSVMLNFVDVERFAPRGPLPARPARAAVFSNYASDATHLRAVREACARAAIPLDVIGSGVGNSCSRPEEVIGRYDLVFAKAKCALEALAVGAAVVLCDFRGAGPMVTSADLDRLRRLNFGARTLALPLRPEVIEREIARYDPADAAAVSRRIRAEASLTTAADALLAFYRDLVAEQARTPAPAPEAESRAAAAYLRRFAPRYREWDGAARQLSLAQAEIAGLKADLAAARAAQAAATDQAAAAAGRASVATARVDDIERTPTWRLRTRLREISLLRVLVTPLVRWLAPAAGVRTAEADRDRKP